MNALVLVENRALEQFLVNITGVTEMGIKINYCMVHPVKAGKLRLV